MLIMFHWYDRRDAVTLKPDPQALSTLSPETPNLKSRS